MRPPRSVNVGGTALEQCHGPTLRLLELVIRNLAGQFSPCGGHFENAATSTAEEHPLSKEPRAQSLRERSRKLEHAAP